jgi:hypothetical protein
MMTLADIQAKFTEQLGYVDDVAQIVLKGHLVMEELMTESIQQYLLHGEFLELARLQFHQKLQLCRAMSVSDEKNDMWNLVASINSLRNHLSHSLDPAGRSKRIEALNATFSKEFPEHVPDDTGAMPREAAICMFAISASLGFLHAHFEEQRRFRSVILDMDKLLNQGKLK